MYSERCLPKMRSRWNCRERGVKRMTWQLDDGTHARVVLLGLAVVAREALLVVRDVDAAVRGSLEHAEDAVAGGGGSDAHVQHGAEGAPLRHHRLHPVVTLVCTRYGW
jgi:hypothetical protein